MNPTEGAAVLTPADIHHIRAFIDDKYRDKPQKERSEIVADAIRRVIYKQLPDFDEEIKREVASLLIHNNIIGNQGIVNSDDIFAACLHLNTSDSSISQPLMSWTEKKLSLTLEASKFQQVISVIKPSPSVPTHDATLHAFSATLLTVDHSSEKTVMDAPLPVSLLRTRRIQFTAILLLLLIGGSLCYAWSLSQQRQDAASAAAAALQVKNAEAAHILAQQKQSASKHIAAPMYENELPQSLKYTDIQMEELSAYLRSRSSMLAKPRYMGAIVAAAKKYNVHPLLLFAITGQEQGFVPKDHKYAVQMANNPFNVHYSWESYNTSIEESSMIAAKTVVNLSKNRPSGADPLSWINRKYAEDPNWSNGVSDILDMLLEIAS